MPRFTAYERVRGSEYPKISTQISPTADATRRQYPASASKVGIRVTARSISTPSINSSNGARGRLNSRTNGCSARPCPGPRRGAAERRIELAAPRAPLPEPARRVRRFRLPRRRPRGRNPTPRSSRFASSAAAPGRSSKSWCRGSWHCRPGQQTRRDPGRVEQAERRTFADDVDLHALDAIQHADSAKPGRSKLVAKPAPLRRRRRGDPASKSVRVRLTAAASAAAAASERLPASPSLWFPASDPLWLPAFAGRHVARPPDRLAKATAARRSLMRRRKAEPTAGPVGHEQIDRQVLPEVRQLKRRAHRIRPRVELRVHVTGDAQHQASHRIGRAPAVVEQRRPVVVRVTVTSCRKALSRSSNRATGNRAAADARAECQKNRHRICGLAGTRPPALPRAMWRRAAGAGAIRRSGDDAPPPTGCLRRRSRRLHAQTRRRPPRRVACAWGPGARQPESSRSAFAPGGRTPHKPHRSPPRGTLPFRLRHSGPVIDRTRHDEQQIREAVEVGDHDRLDFARPSPTTRRSARRHTVRATCSCAPATEPPGRMNRRNGGSSSSSPSIVFSSASTSPVVMAALVILPAIRDDGSARRAPRANNCFWIASSAAAISASTPAERAAPRKALSSSTSP